MGATRKGDALISTPVRHDLSCPYGNSDHSISGNQSDLAVGAGRQDVDVTLGRVF
jgi:hypothetical protein